MSAPYTAPAAPRHPEELHAGVDVVDITPAPGLGLHAHGPAGRVSRGTMLRLRCFPVVLAQGTEVLALVPCDLGWPSMMLQRKVAAKVQALLPRSPDGPPIGAEDIALFATHTHGAPSHQFASSNYSGLLSSPDPGYSEEVTEFLAASIAHGIARAWRSLAPARIGWGFANAWDIGQNRSLDAFGENLLTPDEAGRYTVAEGESLARRVVDPRISVLRIDHLDRRPMGGFAVFGVHGTSVPNTSDVYQGDVFGYASRAFERVCRATHGDGCTLGIANGLSGDVGPAADYPGPREARRLGGRLGRAIAESFGKITTAAPPPGSLRVGYQEVHLPGAPTAVDASFIASVDRIAPWPASRGRAEGARLCDEAALGIAASGGVEESETFFRHLGDMFIEGSPLATDPDGAACHAPKRGLAVLGQSATSFPTVAPVHVALVGDTLVTTFPAEVTVTAGLRARARIEEWIVKRPGPGARPRNVVQVTHATEYFQYVTTDDEYRRQNYEGASTLYGPSSLRLFANEQLCLARQLLDGMPCAVPAELARPAVGRLHALSWSPSEAKKNPYVSELAGRVSLGVPARTTRDGEDGIRVELRETPAGDVTRGIRVWIVDHATGDVVDRDDGDAIVVRFVDEDVPGGCSDAAERRGGCPFWSLGWFPDRAMREALAGRTLRFSVRTPAPPLWEITSSAPFAPPRP